MNVSIKFADVNDAKLLSELGTVCFLEAFGKDNSQEDLKIYLSDAFDIAKTKKELSGKDISFIIAFDETNESVGYAKMSRSENPEELKGATSMLLQRLYVRQKVKGKKVGAALLNKCIEISEKENCRFIWLTVWQENKPAIDFYFKWGFEICGYRQFIIGNKVDDDFMMKKELKEKESTD